MQTLTVRGKTYSVNVPSASMPFAIMNLGRPRIVGIKPTADYDPDLYEELKDAWASRISQREIHTYRVPSSSHPGQHHTVRHTGDYYSCTCPATTECWHIKWVKRKEAGELGQY